MKMLRELQAADLPENIVEQCFEALKEKDRLCYMGSFIHGLIHNINGPLQNVSMLAEFVTKGQNRIREFIDEHGDGEAREASNQLCAKQEQRLEQLSGQISTVVGMLRDFMWLDEVERNESELDVNLVITKLIQVFRADLFFKHNVELELCLGQDLPLVRIPGRHLISALVHLFKNAMIALRGAAKKRLTIESKLSEDKIILVFTDSGCGFAREDIQGLFSPFVSDWPEESIVRQGGIREHHFGLGLFVVCSLLKPYGVLINLERVDSETIASLEIPVR